MEGKPVDTRRQAGFFADCPYVSEGAFESILGKGGVIVERSFRRFRDGRLDSPNEVSGVGVKT